ncbi:MAG: beta-ketoacyl synthase [Allomuricauda sp.]|nr:MAG: beta-ketoacyl synthase [Allomuricauda sp.]
MLKQPIYITSLFSTSALGTSGEGFFKDYQNGKHYLTQREIDGHLLWVGALPFAAKKAIDALKASDPKYRKLDDTVLFAIYAARQALAQSKWDNSTNFGINIGSSRGATTLFEKYHHEFLKNGAAPARTSPSTTMGNISSWVAHDLKTKGPNISHSITCSTALHSLLNGIAWLQSGLADKFLVGGSEAPLTAFTIAQMKALKIYSDAKGDYPCRSLDLSKERDTMVLGEGASIAAITTTHQEGALAQVSGIGFATEPLTHGASLSADGICFQDSMRMALGDISPSEISAIVMHAPGTVQGDISEYRAIQKVFGSQLPFLTTNKWKLGHTFGASGMFSIEMALLMLRHQKCITTPFYEQEEPEKLRYILVNAVGFGGNAVSILVEDLNAPV